MLRFSLIACALLAGIVFGVPASDLGVGERESTEMLAVEFNELEDSVGSYEAHVDVILPPDYYEKGFNTRQRGLPLVLCLPGYGGDRKEHRRHFGLGFATKFKKMIQIYVDGRKDNDGWRYWSAFGPDWTGSCGGGFKKCGDSDVDYLRRVVIEATSRYNVDLRKIFVYGHSNGAAMAYRLACDA